MESSRPDSPEGSGKATYRSQFGWRARLFSKASVHAQNILPHREKERGQASQSASTAPEAPFRNTGKATGQSIEYLLPSRANAGEEFVLRMKRPVPIYDLPVYRCLSF